MSGYFVRNSISAWAIGVGVLASLSPAFAVPINLTKSVDLTTGTIQFGFYESSMQSVAPFTLNSGDVITLDIAFQNNLSLQVTNSIVSPYEFFTAFFYPQFSPEVVIDNFNTIQFFGVNGSLNGGPLNYCICGGTNSAYPIGVGALDLTNSVFSFNSVRIISTVNSLSRSLQFDSFNFYFGSTEPFPNNPLVQIISTPRAVPEPSTLALFGAGLLGLGALRRRRKKA